MYRYVRKQMTRGLQRAKHQAYHQRRPEAEEAGLMPKQRQRPACARLA